MSEILALVVEYREIWNGIDFFRILKISYRGINMLAKYSALFERAFRVFHTVYFDNALPDVVITMQSRPKAFG